MYMFIIYLWLCFFWTYFSILMDKDKASEVSFVVLCSYILSMIPNHLLVIYVIDMIKRK